MNAKPRNMKVTKWMRKKAMQRLIKAENLNISKREKRIKRTMRWAIIAVLAWVVPFTTEYSETIIIENVYAGASIDQENISSPEMGTDEGGAGVNAVEGGDVISKIVSSLPEPDIALAIAKAESGLNPKAESMTDRLADGRAFSHGLFQINLTVSNVAGVKCNEAFEGRDYKAKVINEELFEKCVRLAHDVDTSIEVAKAKYEGRGNWTAWGAYTSGVYKRFL